MKPSKHCLIEFIEFQAELCNSYCAVNDAGAPSNNRISENIAFVTMFLATKTFHTMTTLAWQYFITRPDWLHEVEVRHFIHRQFWNFYGAIPICKTGTLTYETYSFLQSHAISSVTNLSSLNFNYSGVVAQHRWWKRGISRTEIWKCDNYIVSDKYKKDVKYVYIILCTSVNGFSFIFMR